MRDVLLLLALPLLLVLINNNWIFNPPSDFPDSWFYLTNFRHFFDFAPNYPSNIHYFTERLTWNLLGYAFYHVFTPLVANYLLHLLVAYTAIFSLYGILLRLFGRQTALLVSLILSAYPWFLRSVGWDYLDGFGIAQVLLMLYLLIWAAQAKQKQARWILAAAGAVFASVLIANLFWVGFVPSFVIVYYVANTKNRRHRPLFSTLCFLLGFTALVVVLALFYNIVTRHYVFIANSVAFTVRLSNAAAQNNANLRKYYGLMPPFWLVLPLLVGVLSIFALLRKSSQNNWQLRLSVVSYVLAFGFLIFYHFYSQIYLNVYLYASYLIPSVFICLGAVAAPTLQKLSIRQSHWIGAIAIALLALPLLIATAVPEASRFQGNIRLLILAMLVIALALLVVSNVKVAALMTIAASALLCFLSDPPTVINQVYNAGHFSAQDTFNVVMAFTDQMDKTHNPADYNAFRLWTSQEPDNGTNVGIIAMYLYPWGRALEGSLLPLPRKLSMYRGMILSSDKDLIIISPHDQAIVENEAGNILAQIGAGLNIQSQQKIEFGHLTLTYYIARLFPISKAIGYNQVFWFDHAILYPNWYMPANNPDEFQIWTGPGTDSQLQFTLPRAAGTVQFELCAAEVAVPNYTEYLHLTINDQPVSLDAAPDGDCAVKFTGLVPPELLLNDQNQLTLTFKTDSTGIVVRSFPHSSPAKAGVLYKWLRFIDTATS
jgi:4-amino-4-deoxy-L-arabinose transferase-like glycosyltransferase